MRKEIADKWVVALRSGEYKQGMGLLKKADKFCCLGVLCDISGLGNWRDYRGRESYLHRRVALPKKVMKWSGIKNAYGKFTDSLGLGRLNDTGHGFRFIASVIEKNWRKL